MRLTETLTRDWLNTNEPREMVVNNHVAVHHQLTNHNIDWDSAQCLTTVQTIFNDWLWKAGTLTYNKPLLTDVNNCRHLTKDLSATKTKPTDRLTLTNNRRTKNRPIRLTKDVYHHGFTDQSLSTDQTSNIIDCQTHYSLNSEDNFHSGCQNVSHHQQFFWELC